MQRMTVHPETATRDQRGECRVRALPTPSMRTWNVQFGSVEKFADFIQSAKINTESVLAASEIS
jgi:hypothetical protein